MKIEDRLAAAAADAVKALYGCEAAPGTLQLQKTKKRI